MANPSSADEPSNNMTPSFKPLELSFPLPRSTETQIHLHLSHLSRTLLLFLTTAPGGGPSTAAPLGSFVYALPDVRPHSS